MDDFCSGRGFVSAPFAPQTGLSGFGALLQVARLNHFHGQDFLAAFGLRFQYREDLSAVLAFASKRKSILASALVLPPEMTAGWSLESWQPFDGNDPWNYLLWTLRACASCLRSGYHSNLFQLPWIRRCPWHREDLITGCRKCRTPLLDGFKARRALLQCTCGYDPLDEMAVLRGEPSTIVRERDEFFREYLAWVAECRGFADLLICPEEADPYGWAALCALVQPPECLKRWRLAFGGTDTEMVHVVQRTRRSLSAPLDKAEHQIMVRCAHSLWPDTPGMAELPAEFRSSLVNVLRQIAVNVPDSALTTREREVMALLPTPKAMPASMSRYELTFLPAQCSGERLFLDVRVLHRTAGRALSHIASQLIANDPSCRLSADGSHRLLINVMKQTLCRGYADGIKHVLGRHVPAIFDHPRIRVGPRLPWALLRRKGGTAHGIRMAWSVRRAWEDVV